MDYWDPSIVYQMVVEQHRERVARGEAAQRLEAVLGARSVRTRLATAFVALACRLDPDRCLVLPGGAARAQHASS